MNTQLIPTVCVGCQHLAPFVADFDKQKQASDYYGLCLWHAASVPYWLFNKVGKAGVLVKLKQSSLHQLDECAVKHPKDTGGSD